MMIAFIITIGEMIVIAFGTLNVYTTLTFFCFVYKMYYGSIFYSNSCYVKYI